MVKLPANVDEVCIFTENSAPGGSIGKYFDTRMKALSELGKAIGTAARGIATLASKEADDTIFNLAISQDNAPTEGASYKKGSRVFATAEASKVLAVLRIQWQASVELGDALGLGQSITRIRTMVLGGFIYLLEDDSAGAIVQLPIVPKVEAGGELPIEVKALPIAPLLAVKAETEFENTFFWLNVAGVGGVKTIKAIVNLLNAALPSSSGFTIALQACENNSVST